MFGAIYIRSRSILNNFSDYYALIERNYAEVLNNHTWENRWDAIKKKLNEN